MIMWHLPEHGELDVYRITRGSTLPGEYTGRSIGWAVFHAAVEHAEPARAVWLKDDRPFRRLNPAPGGN
jgi:hypothetical protein